MNLLSAKQDRGLWDPIRQLMVLFSRTSFNKESVITSPTKTLLVTVAVQLIKNNEPVGYLFLGDPYSKKNPQLASYQLQKILIDHGL
jgi:hypothetical protein